MAERYSDIDWALVDVQDEHWVWKGDCRSNGYPIGQPAAKILSAVTGEDIRKIQNHCGKKNCVNPDHWSWKWPFPGEVYEDGSRECVRCGETIDAAEVVTHRRTCRSCERKRSREYHSNNRETIRARHRNQQLQRTYGISQEEYLNLLEAQEGVCDICLNTCPTGRNLAVDHHHKTGRVRGLLCIKCNQAIGMLHEDKEIILRALDYLKKYE